MQTQQVTKVKLKRYNMAVHIYEFKIIVDGVEQTKNIKAESEEEAKQQLPADCEIISIDIY
jgi:hypothetical protein